MNIRSVCHPEEVTGPTLARGVSQPSPIAVGPAALLVPNGRVVELSAAVPQGRLTLAAQFVVATQRAGEASAWVQPEGAGLFPPDLAAAGVRLDDLVVVHTPRGDPSAVARASELLLRSGGFGLVVMDLVAATPRGESWIVRLGGLARHHDARVVLLTSHAASQPSSGALVAVRIEPRRTFAAGAFVIDPTVLRDRCDLARRVAATTHRPPWGGL